MDLAVIGVVAVICLIIGFVAAILFNNLRASDTPVEQKETPPDCGLVEILRLWRRPDGGTVQPEIEGQILKTAADLTAEQHAKISLVLVDLYAWMEDAGLLTPKLEISPVKQKKPAPPVAREAITGFEEVKPASMNVFKSLVKTAQKEVSEKIESGPQSLSAQVDEILQEKLEGTALAHKGIRLMDLPNQGMVIMVGMDKYNEVEAVPDEEIKALLRAAVAEWEARMLGASRPA